MTKKNLAILALSLLCTTAAQAEKVYRWTDENGEVHFGATLPPEYADKPYEVINESGIVIRRVDPTARSDEDPEAMRKEETGPEPLFTEEEIRIRSDRLLVLKYHSEDEILEAMNVEIANLGYDKRIIEQTHQSVLKSMESQVKEAADRQRAGMPADPDTDRKIAQLRIRLLNGVEALAELDTREGTIRADFMKELERYRHLMSEGPDEEAP